MSGITTTESARPARGWGAAFALACATLLFSTFQPALLIFVPLAVLLVALPPRRPVLVVAAAGLIWLAFSGTPDGALWYVERGWALLLVQRAGFGQVERVVDEQLRASASQTLSAWTAAFGFERVSGELSSALYAAVDLQSQVFPALLALGSLAALAVAWFAYRRLGHGDAAPLGRLREFRFPDDLVWVLVGGVVLLVLPLGALAERTGTNLLAFMAALYALRGLAVLVVLAGAPGPIAMVIGGLLLVFLYPLVMATTVVLGVTDTWLDIRARRAALPPSS